jgi:hypothetical protein
LASIFRARKVGITEQRGERRTVSAERSREQSREERRGEESSPVGQAEPAEGLKSHAEEPWRGEASKERQARRGKERR